MADESKVFGAQGGKARAASLTKAELSAQGKNAAAARWGRDLPVAEYPGVLQIGDLQFPCAVLSDHKTRVLTQSDFMAGMGMYYSGWFAKTRTPNDGSEDIPHFLQFKNLKPFIDKHLPDLKSVIVRYRTSGGAMALGIRAEIIPKICEIWMDADEAGVLGSRQKVIAKSARSLMRALAYKAIEMLVDDATGFRQDKDQRDIARHIQAYVAKDFRQWVRTFPRSFFEQLCRLHGKNLPANMKLPQYYGHYINDLVWDRLAPGVRDELRRRNPTINGRRKHKHHSLLTQAVGLPRLLHHLGLLEGYASMFGEGEWDAFHHLVDEKMTNYGPLFSGFAESGKVATRRRNRAISVKSSAALPPESGDQSELALPALSSG